MWRRETVEVKSGKQAHRELWCLRGDTSLDRKAATPQRLLTSQSRALDDRGDTPHPRPSTRIAAATAPGTAENSRPGSGASTSTHPGARARRETTRNLARNPRRVLDFLKMTANGGQRPADRSPQPPPSPCPDAGIIGGQVQGNFGLRSRPNPTTPAKATTNACGRRLDHRDPAWKIRTNLSWGRIVVLRLLCYHRRQSRGASRGISVRFSGGAREWEVSLN